MATFLIRRCAQAGVVLFAITIATFLLLQLAPGDPVRTLVGIRATPETVARIRATLSLDDPLPAQYLRFVGDALAFNFGYSLRHGSSVGSVIGSRIEVTMLLGVCACAIAVVIALPLGVLSAVRRNRFADHGIRVATMVTFAMPPFWLGLLLVLLFSLNLGWLPSSGYAGHLGQRAESLVLPALTLGLGLAPVLVRTLRSSMIEAFDSEYVEAARARGLPERRVIYKHALRNSLLASLTVLGVNVAAIMSGAVVVENVFALPGMGTLLVDSVAVRDLPTVQGVALVFGAAVVIVNLLTDIAYAVIDPRIRL